MFIAERAQPDHKLFGRYVEPAFTLYRFQNNSGYVIWCRIIPKDPINASHGVFGTDPMQSIWIKCSIYRARHQAHPCRIGRHLPSERESHHGTSMISSRECDNTATAGGSPCNLDRVLNGFGTSSYEKRFLFKVSWNQCVEFFTKLHVRLISKDVEACMS